MQTDRRSLVIGLSRALLAGAAAGTIARGDAAAQEAQRTPAPKQAELPPGATSNHARVNGVRLHYIAAGTGPLIVLLHGWPQTWYAWHAIIPTLAARYRVIAPDLRGTGQSERPAGGYDKRTIAEDLRGLIGHAGAAQAVVVGHDMGGKAAYVLAHLYPDLVTRLALVDCLLPGTENMDTLRGGAWHYGFHMAAKVPEMLTKGRERAYISAQIKAWSHNKEAIGEAAIDEYARHYAGPGGMTAGFNYYRALREDAPFAATLRGRKLAMPVLAITGRFGVGDKLANALKGEADRLTAVVVEDSGHFVAEESPATFTRELERFLAA